MSKDSLTVRVSEAEEGKAIIEWTSEYGSTATWTLTAYRAELNVHGKWTTAGGEVSEDCIKMAPVDANTVTLFI